MWGVPAPHTIFLWAELYLPTPPSSFPILNENGNKEQVAQHQHREGGGGGGGHATPPHLQIIYNIAKTIFHLLVFRLLVYAEDQEPGLVHHKHCIWNIHCFCVHYFQDLRFFSFYFTVLYSVHTRCIQLFFVISEYLWIYSKREKTNLGTKAFIWYFWQIGKKRQRMSCFPAFF